MNKVLARYVVLNLALFFILLMIILSITGAFLGAEKASLFFNSPPLAVFWILLTFLFAAGFVVWKSLRRRPFLLLCHAGCIAVLIGGMWGSRPAHHIRERFGVESKAFKSMMLLRPGQSSRTVVLDDRTGTFDLPFTVHMLDTQVSHYDQPSIGIYNQAGRLVARIAMEPDYLYQLEDLDLAVQIARRYDNLRLERGPDGVRGIEGSPDTPNPGYEVLFILPDGTHSRQYVFERFEPHMMPEIPYLARYLAPMQPREYTSLLQIEHNGQIATEKTIRVNDPLYYKGYHFYQSTFGQDELGPYSGIMVVSDSGIRLVFFGYTLITVGLFGQYWLLPLKRRRTQREVA